MQLRDVRLEDRYNLETAQVLVNGTQALVRLVLMQGALDRAAGHHTAGYISGYRGSPLGSLDVYIQRAAEQLTASDILFHAGLNEDIAATAIWGTQQAHLRGEGTHDGVFGLWYGKGPGVDRSGDALRHANFSGTAPLGGVVMAVGDDHTCESSTTLHQSEMALMDAYIPILSPAGVQEIIDYGLLAYQLSRFAGVWVGLKLVKDTVEATGVIEAGLERPEIILPEVEQPDGGLNIRLGETPHSQEERLVRYRKPAVEAFARANRLDKRGVGAPGAKIGFVAAGKNWLDLLHALELLGIDGQSALDLGLTTYKVAMTWPLEGHGLREWAEGLDLVFVVEEKRKLLETQIKEALFDVPDHPRVIGGNDGRGQVLLQTHGALEPVQIALALAETLESEGRSSDAIRAAAMDIRQASQSSKTPALATRTPYFCAGCPHNTSTQLPQGSRAYAGIGCHYLVQLMDRDTLGYTHMGGEGANWIGEAPFSKLPHVFQNIGDGTYNHSGLMSIRGAVAAGTTMTYKILFNDAVAMTGGQINDGGLGAQRICAELLGIGVARVTVVYDDQEDFDPGSLPGGIEAFPREDLDRVQKDLREVPGVTALVYVQTCAAEKRRRRKRGTMTDPAKRVFINTDVCEGCGDCGVQSNCVALVPVDTPLGRKRGIDQSSCNKDFSCLKGFCPAFVTLEGGELRKEAAQALEIPQMPEPDLPAINGTHNIVINGIGGTGAVTIGVVLATAAHLDGKAAGMMEMAGLAQKGGAVLIHCRIAEHPKDIAAVRVALGEADLLLGGDLVVSASPQTLSLARLGRTQAVVNSHEVMTGAFATQPDFVLPGAQLSDALRSRMGESVALIDSSDLARRSLGDTLFGNMILLGAAWQKGLMPLSREAILAAIAQNGAAVAQNQRAFEVGRLSAADPDAVGRYLSSDSAKTLSAEEEIAQWEAHLVGYQSRRLARKFRAFIDPIEDVELRRDVAFSYQKLLSYKDEYEVARLLQSTGAQISRVFSGTPKLGFHLAPPVLSSKGQKTRPRKRQFGAWIVPVLNGLSRFKGLRGTPFDVFGYSAERRAERALIAEFEGDMAHWLPKVTPQNRAAIRALAVLPQSIRGFGPVKSDAMERAALRRVELLEQLASDTAKTATAAA